MTNNNLKMLLASSIAYKANNKAVREINSEGNHVNGFDEPEIKVGSNFDKYLNTYVALLSYVENHNHRSNQLDADGVDPEDYQIPAKFNQLLNCAKVYLCKGADSLSQAIYSYPLPKGGDYMQPSLFNAYQERFKTVGDDKLFSEVQSFNPQIVTLDELKCITNDDGELFTFNPDGKYSGEISYAMGIKLPVDNISQYTTKGVQLDREAVIVWLSK